MEMFILDCLVELLAKAEVSCILNLVLYLLLDE